MMRFAIRRAATATAVLFSIPLAFSSAAIVVSFSIFGVSEFSARFGSAVFGLGVVACLILLGNRYETAQNRPHADRSAEVGRFGSWLGLIAATSLGVGSCWIGLTAFFFANREKVRELGIPEGCVPYYSVTLGYPDPTFTPGAPRRKENSVFRYAAPGTKR